MSATLAAVRDLLADGASRETVAASLTLAGVVVLLAQDPALVAMAEANDAERFAEGCRTPAFGQKVGAALLAIRDAATGSEAADA